jgi:hypothetical protein
MRPGERSRQGGTQVRDVAPSRPPIPRRPQRLISMRQVSNLRLQANSFSVADVDNGARSR